MHVLTAFYNALRLPELRNKILFTGGCLVVFRMLANVVVPGTNAQALQSLFNSQALLGLLDLFSGGGLSRFSVVAMGLNPYINATIIMQLMQVVSPRLKAIQREGELGRRRITRWTRYLTVALGVAQAYGFTVLFQRYQVLPANLDWFQRVVIIITLTAGTIVAMWLGELITEHGIGNGVSLLITAGILGKGSFASVTGLVNGSNGLAGYLPLVGIALLALLVTAFIIEVQQAQRKIRIQSAQRIQGGARTIQARESFLPLRVNQAGVIPIIFAFSVMYLPTIAASYLAATSQGSWTFRVSQWIQANWQPTGPNLQWVILYNVIYFLLIFGFTYFYTFVTFEPDEVADNLKRSSSFIPGIRPGAQTSEYLYAVMSRITFAGAVFLGLIAVVVPTGASLITHVSQQQLYLGGTGILIVVGVSLDTMRQLETQLVMRQYRGFIR